MCRSAILLTPLTTYKIVILLTHKGIDMKKIIATICAIGTLTATAQAAIEYGGQSYEAPFAASSTAKVGEVVDEVITDGLGASSTTDVAGITRGAGNLFTRINNWLADKAGIDLLGILRAIGHFFVVIVTFVIDLIKKLI